MVHIGCGGELAYSNSVSVPAKDGEFGYTLITNLMH